MSVRVTTLVWAKSRQTGSCLLMLLAIADHADDHGNAFPGVKSLARKCRVSHRQANSIMARLRTSGELEVRHNQGPRGTNLYRVVLSALEGVPPASVLMPSASLQSTSRPPEAHFLEPLKPTSDEPSMNHQEPSLKRTRSSSSFLTSMPAEFAISDAVRLWASKEGYAAHLQAHFDHFVGYAKASGKRYADWDAALKNSIRADWGGIRKQSGSGETAYQRQVRERMCAAVPRIAAGAPGTRITTIDMETFNAAAIGMG
jgi:hypothetical protein